MRQNSPDILYSCVPELLRIFSYSRASYSNFTKPKDFKKQVWKNSKHSLNSPSEIPQLIKAVLTCNKCQALCLLKFFSLKCYFF